MAADDTRQDTPIRNGASAVLFRGSKVLLVRRGKGAARGLWSLPGGHVEHAERPEDAALRETVEETGIRASLLGLVGEHHVTVPASADAPEVCYRISVFHGLAGDGEPVAASDAEAAAFVETSEVHRLATTEGAAAIIERAWALSQGHGSQPSLLRNCPDRDAKDREA